MKKLQRLFLLIFSIILVVSMFSLVSAAAERDCLYYFWGEECTSCLETETFLKGLEQKYPELTIQKLESYHNQDNAQLLRQYFTAYDISDESQGVPAVFIANSYLIGSGPIKEMLEDRIKDNQEIECPSLTPGATVGLAGDKEPRHIIETITFSMVTENALKDTFSSVHLILIVILLGIILILRDLNTVLKKGLLFIAGVFLAHFLFGVGFFPGLSQGIVFSKLFAVIALIMSGLQIWSFLKKRPPKTSSENVLKMKKYLLSSWGIFLIALIASIFTVSALGKTFDLLAEFSQHSYTSGIALPSLLIFLIILIISQLVIVVVSQQLWKQFLMHAQEKAKVEVHLSRWRNHFRKVFNFIVAGVMFLFSLLILFL